MIFIYDHYFHDNRHIEASACASCAHAGVCRARRGSSPVPHAGALLPTHLSTLRVALCDSRPPSLRRWRAAWRGWSSAPRSCTGSSRASRALATHTRLKMRDPWQRRRACGASGRQGSTWGIRWRTCISWTRRGRPGSPGRTARTGRAGPHGRAAQGIADTILALDPVSILDVGAGSGQYGRYFGQVRPELQYDGVDGALNVEEFTSGLVSQPRFDLDPVPIPDRLCGMGQAEGHCLRGAQCARMSCPACSMFQVGWADLSQELHAPRSEYDWVMSLEVRLGAGSAARCSDGTCLGACETYRRKACCPDGESPCMRRCSLLGRGASACRVRV